MIKGKIKLIRDTQTFASGFCKREFVVTTDEQYPQEVPLEFVKDKCSILDRYRTGDSVEVQFNIRGSEYNGRYFVNLQAWKISKADGASASQESAPAGQRPPSTSYSPPVEDDLPF